MCYKRKRSKELFGYNFAAFGWDVLEFWACWKRLCKKSCAHSGVLWSSACATLSRVAAAALHGCGVGQFETVTPTCIHETLEKSQRALVKGN